MRQRWQAGGLAAALLVLPSSAPLRWTTGEPLPRGVDHHATFVTTGSAGAILHVLGGNDYQQQSAEHWSAPLRPDGSLGPWTSAPPFSKPILGHTVLVVGRTAIAIAGQNAGRQNSPGVFTAPLGADGSLGAWSPAPPLPAARFHHAAVAAGSTIYVLGGLETTSSTSTVFRSRVAANGALAAWETLEAMPRSRSHGKSPGRSTRPVPRTARSSTRASSTSRAASRTTGASWTWCSARRCGATDRWGRSSRARRCRRRGATCITCRWWDPSCIRWVGRGRARSSLRCSLEGWTHDEGRQGRRGRRGRQERGDEGE